MYSKGLGWLLHVLLLTSHWTVLLHIPGSGAFLLNISMTCVTNLHIFAHQVHPFVVMVFPEGSGLSQQDDLPRSTALENGSRNMTKGSRCCLGLQIPKISIRSSVWGTCKSEQQVRSVAAPPRAWQDLKEVMLMIFWLINICLFITNIKTCWLMMICFLKQDCMTVCSLWSQNCIRFSQFASKLMIHILIKFSLCGRTGSFECRCVWFDQIFSAVFHHLHTFLALKYLNIKWSLSYYWLVLFDQVKLERGNSQSGSIN